ncbi:MAG: ABC transporter permease [Clostridia bacterium]|nr:ABC transporter permease [Clostridia bacterium]
MAERKFKRTKNFLSFQINTDKLIPATSEEKMQASLMRDSHTFFRDAMKRFAKNKIAMTCAVLMLIIVLGVIFIPIAWPYKYDQQLGMSLYGSDASYNNLSPMQYGETEQARIANGEKVFPHLFGTDSLGRDYFIRVVYGTRISLAVGFFASILVLIIGLIYGSVSGYVGGKVDLVMMRIVDIIYSLPDMLMIILLSVVLNRVLGDNTSGIFDKLGTNMISIFLVFALLYWVGMARLIRGQILTLKKQEYVLAAKSIGAKPGRIIAKHLIPNCLSIIIITTALQIPSAIFTESFLSFLGLGVSAPMPSLGSLASEARAGVFTYPFRMIIPALFICIIVLSLNLIGDGLRDAFDPKLKD